MWAGTAQGVARFDRHRWTSWTTDEITDKPIRWIALADGHVWAATRGHADRHRGEVMRFDGREWSATDEGVFAVPTTLLAGEDALWVGTGAGLARYSPAPMSLLTCQGMAIRAC